MATLSHPSGREGTEPRDVAHPGGRGGKEPPDLAHPSSRGGKEPPDLAHPNAREGNERSRTLPTRNAWEGDEPGDLACSRLSFPEGNRNSS